LNSLLEHEEHWQIDDVRWQEDVESLAVLLNAGFQIATRPLEGFVVGLDQRPVPLKILANDKNSQVLHKWAVLWII